MITQEDIARLTKQKMEAMGISEEFLMGETTHSSFFDPEPRITVSPRHNAVFHRVLKRIMRPNVFCKAVPGGAVAAGKRFRSLRLARVFYKTTLVNVKIKPFQSLLNPVLP